MIYPKWIFHKTEPAKIVNSEAEHAEAGEGWEETPAAFHQKSDEATEASNEDQGEGEQKASELEKANFAKMTNAQLIDYLVSKGFEHDAVKSLKKDQLIEKVGEI